MSASCWELTISPGLGGKGPEGSTLSLTSPSAAGPALTASVALGALAMVTATEESLNVSTWIASASGVAPETTLVAPRALVILKWRCRAGRHAARRRYPGAHVQGLLCRRHHGERSERHRRDQGGPSDARRSEAQSASLRPLAAQPRRDRQLPAACLL